MPTARYDLLDSKGEKIGTEDLRCAPGPMGWRSFSTIVRDGVMTRADISVDSAWKPVRIRIENDEHHLLLARRGTTYAAQLDGERFEFEDATVIQFPAPAFLVAASRASTSGGSTPAIGIDLLTLRPSIAASTLETTGVMEEVETAVGVFTAQRWTTGGRDFWVAGDMLVAGPGMTLATYDKGGQGPIPH